ncbi:hypothetical protein O0I10_006949 [Lichtheimia ornata]|uniref:tRNA-dihydrouridine(47) synthase [NAD(P)(+)] n=1 Tax=Lichtheimia ornata TaxID=688661 RepID=A0AAD7V164_9FUNG|nr:uncharacterized protein O0I10_006949 [Lichtheimia ornata]KAJ8657393.1 hypothetical protein O0I10_006949 [Lichtheimia ornata]
MATIERKAGEAPIKPEYRKEKWFDDDSNEDGSNAVFGDDDAEGKRFGGGDNQKRRNTRGANKGQRGKKRIVDEVKICKMLAANQECIFKEECRFSHDLKKYLETKPADLGDRCIQFDLFGSCRHGYKCRFLKAHMDADGNLIKNEELIKKNPVYTTNGISPETQKALMKGKYEFPKATAFLKEMEAELANQPGAQKKRKIDDVETEDGSKESKAEEKAEPATDSSSKPEIDADLPDVNMNVEPKVGPIDEERPYKKLIDFRNKTYLAPLTTVGNLPFRRICKEYGVDITCGEMALCKNLLQGQQSEWALTKRHVSEDIFGIQICGARPDQVARACEVINDEIDVDFVDLNMGCPIDLVFNTGAGSALPESKGKMTRVLKGMRRMLDVPVTVKFRTGIKHGVLTNQKLIPVFESLDISLGTIHGRSRQQRYTKLSNWDFIRDVKQLSKNMPIYGNGDVLSFEDYNKHKEETGVDGIMIGRGALIKPWIFDEIKQQRHWDISSKERFEMLKRFCDYGLEHWGTDSQGVNTTRRFLCEWQSFLYRYIPAGLLEVLPQRINERAPPFRGRDELEDLMASPRASDWVKLSERLLGPAPEDFVFMPKHKANSFEG